MPSPFPGVDPFLESQHYWQDFHATFVPCWRKLISKALPPHYEARIEEQVEILELESDAARLIRPDVSIIHDPDRSLEPTYPQTSPRGSTTLEAVTLPLPIVEEVRDRWIQVFHRPSRSLVAILELLSPANKTNPGRGQYLAKRSRLFVEQVHLVEVDLLLAGQRLPMAKPLPKGDFFAFVARSDTRPNADVYAWSLCDRLPVIPIPLLKPDRDILIDLAAVFSLAYDRGDYAKSIDYSAPLELPLDPAALRWALQTARPIR